VFLACKNQILIAGLGRGVRRPPSQPAVTGDTLRQHGISV